MLQMSRFWLRKRLAIHADEAKHKRAGTDIEKKSSDGGIEVLDWRTGFRVLNCDRQGVQTFTAQLK
jgi:hypothetical protein